MSKAAETVRAHPPEELPKSHGRGTKRGRAIVKPRQVPRIKHDSRRVAMSPFDQQMLLAYEHRLTPPRRTAQLRAKIQSHKNRPHATSHGNTRVRDPPTICLTSRYRSAARTASAIVAAKRLEVRRYAHAGWHHRSRARRP